MVATSLAGLGASAYQMIDSAEKANSAENALANYERQKLKNIAEDLQVSTIGADRRRESLAQLSAGQVDALRGDSRTLLGGIGRVEANNNLVNAEISSDLDMQQKEIDRMIAGDEANIRGMQENREVGDISALSSQVNAGNQNFNQAMGNAFQSAGMLANNIGRNANPNTTTNTASGYDANGKFIEPAINTTETPSFVPLENTSTPTTMTRTGGSGMGATNQQFDEYGQPINPYGFNFSPVQRRPRMGGMQYNY